MQVHWLAYAYALMVVAAAGLVQVLADVIVDTIGQRPISKLLPVSDYSLWGSERLAKDDGIMTISMASKLRAILNKARGDAETLTRNKSLPPMEYDLFRGVSALRSLSKHETSILDPSYYGLKIDSSEHAKASFYRSASILLLLAGNPSAAHEILLGVTFAELEDAEFAATHPGQTPWAQNHPQCFTDTSDLLHSILHRFEGPHFGEGNHTGYENAKYWALGGPEFRKTPAPHPIRELLTKRAREVAPLCCASRGLLGLETEASELRADDDRVGVWDDLAFIDLCRRKQEGKLAVEECEEVVHLQVLEICTLLRTELSTAFGANEGMTSR